MYGILRRHVWSIVLAMVAASVLTVALALGPTVGRQEAGEAAAQSPVAQVAPVALEPTAGEQAGGGGAAQSSVQKDAWQIPIGISEICPVPAAGQSSWVELMSFGEEPVQIGGWCLSDTRGSRYVFPEDLPPVPPKGIVLVSFQGPAGPPNDDKDFSGENVARLFSRAADANKSFLGQIGECALYNSGDVNTRQIVEYVSWGQWETTDNSERADALGLWPAGASVQTTTSEAPGYMPALVAGGSIGRMVFSKREIDPVIGQVKQAPSAEWGLYRPHEVTPGERNVWPSPLLHRPNKAVFASSASTNFSWRGADMLCRLPDVASWRSHIQVAIDPDFNHLVIDKYVTAPYRHVPPLTVGEYYWRVRVERGSEATAWSLTGELEARP